MSLMHTTFEDGPARGARLSLGRSPILLRVVIDRTGTVDALDQVDDTPRPGEAIHVYVLAEKPGVCHIDYRDTQGRRRGEWRSTGTYHLAPIQPEDAVLRDTARWQAWCRHNFPVLAPDWARDSAVMPEPKKEPRP